MKFKPLVLRKEIREGQSPHIDLRESFYERLIESQRERNYMALQFDSNSKDQAEKDRALLLIKEQQHKAQLEAMEKAAKEEQSWISCVNSIQDVLNRSRFSSSTITHLLRTSSSCKNTQQKSQFLQGLTSQLVQANEEEQYIHYVDINTIIDTIRKYGYPASVIPQDVTMVLQQSQQLEVTFQQLLKQQKDQQQNMKNLSYRKSTKQQLSSLFSSPYLRYLAPAITSAAREWYHALEDYDTQEKMSKTWTNPFPVCLPYLTTFLQQTNRIMHSYDLLQQQQQPQGDSKIEEEIRRIICSPWSILAAGGSGGGSAVAAGSSVNKISIPQIVSLAHQVHSLLLTASTTSSSSSSTTAYYYAFIIRTIIDQVIASVAAPASSTTATASIEDTSLYYAAFLATIYFTIAKHSSYTNRNKKNKKAEEALASLFKDILVSILYTKYAYLIPQYFLIQPAPATAPTAATTVKTNNIIHKTAQEQQEMLAMMRWYSSLFYYLTIPSQSQAQPPQEQGGSSLGERVVSLAGSWSWLYHSIQQLLMILTIEGGRNDQKALLTISSQPEGTVGGDGDNGGGSGGGGKVMIVYYSLTSLLLMLQIFLQRNYPYLLSSSTAASSQQQQLFQLLQGLSTQLTKYLTSTTAAKPAKEKTEITHFLSYLTTLLKPSTPSTQYHYYFYHHQDIYLLYDYLSYIHPILPLEQEIASYPLLYPTTYTTTMKRLQLDRIRTIFNKLSATRESQDLAVRSLFEKMIIASQHEADLHAEQQQQQQSAGQQGILLKSILVKIILNLLTDCQSEFFQLMDSSYPTRYAYLLRQLTLTIADKTFTQMMQGYFYMMCPLLLPKILSEGKDENTASYLQSMGFLLKDIEKNLWESSEEWLTRMSKILAVYTMVCCLTSEDEDGQAVSKDKDKESELGWNLSHLFTWLIRVVNVCARYTTGSSKPAFFLPTIFEIVLRMSADRLYKRYGEVFMQVMKMILEQVLPKYDAHPPAAAGVVGAGAGGGTESVAAVPKKEVLQQFLSRFVQSQGRDFMSLFTTTTAT